MAGSSNFQIFNPTATNQDSDSAYTADTLRSGGISASPTPFAAVLANKMYYQWSVAIAAIMQMMANKGFAVSDASYATLTGVLANILTTADQRSLIQTPAFASTLALDISKASSFHITLSGDTTISFTGMTPGQRVLLAFLQDGTGGHNVTMPAGTGSGQVQGAGSVDPTPGSLSIQEYWTDPSDNLRAVTGQTVTP